MRKTKTEKAQSESKIQSPPRKSLFKSKTQIPNQVSKKTEQGLSKSQSQTGKIQFKSQPQSENNLLKSKSQKSEYAGKNTLNREALVEACGELKKQYTEVLPELSNQINEVDVLTKEVISLLKELNLQDAEEKETKETLLDNTTDTLTGGKEKLTELQGFLQDFIKKLEGHKQKIKLQIQKESVYKGIKNDLEDIRNEKEARFKQLEKGMERIRESRAIQKNSSYQVFNEKLNDKSGKLISQVNQKISGRTLQEELEGNVRKTIPEDLQGEFDDLLRFWQQRSNSSKSQSNEEKRFEENPGKGTVISYENNR